MGLVWIWAVFLLMGSVMFLLCWRLAMRHSALKFAGLWVGPDLCVEMEVFWKSSHQLMFFWVGSSLVIQNPGFRSPASELQAQPLKVAEKNPQATQHRRQIWKQMVKAILIRKEHPKRLIHSQNWNKRGKRIKTETREESNQANNQTYKWRWILKTSLAKIQNQKHGKMQYN